MPLAVSNVSNSLFVLHGQNSSLKLIFGQLDDTKSMDVGVALAPQVGRIISRKEGGGSAEGAGGVLSLLPVSRVSAGFSFPALPPSLPGPCQSGQSIVDAVVPAAQVPVEGTSSSMAAVQVAVERLPYQGVMSDSLQVAVEGVPHSIVASLVGVDPTFQCGKPA